MLPSVNFENNSTSSSQKNQEDLIKNKNDTSTVKLNWKLGSNFETNNQIKNELILENLVLNENGFEVKKFKCELCNFSTLRKSYLLRHKKKHNGIKYKCTECSYESSKANLLSHKRKHNGTKYKCTECCYESNSHSNLW